MAELEKLAVLEAYRHHGLARQLIVTAMRDLIARVSLARVYWNSRPSPRDGDSDARMMKSGEGGQGRSEKGIGKKRKERKNDALLRTYAAVYGVIADVPSVGPQFDTLASFQRCESLVDELTRRKRTD